MPATLSFNLKIDKSERNTRRNLMSFRAGFGVDANEDISVDLTPSASRSLSIPSKFILVMTNVPDSIRLNVTKGADTTQFLVNGFCFISDMTNVTALSVSNASAAGPSVNARILLG